MAFSDAFARGAAVASDEGSQRLALGLMGLDVERQKATANTAMAQKEQYLKIYDGLNKTRAQLVKEIQDKKAADPSFRVPPSMMNSLAAFDEKINSFGTVLGFGPVAGSSADRIGLGVDPVAQKVRETEALAGPQAEADRLKLATTQPQRVADQTALDTARAKTEEETAKRRTELIGGLSGDQKRQMSALLGGAGPEDTDVFFRALTELEGAEPGSKRAQTIEKRINSLLNANKAGFAIQFTPEGKIAAIAQGADTPSIMSGLTAKQTLDQVERIQTLRSNMSLVDGLLAALDEDPTRFGILGTVRRGTQTAVGVSADLAQLVSNITGGSIDLKKAAGNITALLKDAKMDKELGGFFDPKIADIQLVENTLAFELARLRITRSGGGIRALTAAFKDAKNDVSLTGFNSSEDVKSRLANIRQQFAEEFENLSRATTGEAASAGPARVIEFDETGKRK